jgi:chorismate-pyruvate lyase
MQNLPVPHRSNESPLREPFLHRPTNSLPFGKYEETIRALLLAQDGSTTSLLESLGRAEVCVHVIDQHVVEKLPFELDGELPGTRFLRRLASLCANGHVLLDSLSYTAVDVLPRSVSLELVEGAKPIGHVLSGLWTRREFRDRYSGLLEELWDAVGDPDPQSSRTMCISTPRAPCMLLAETFRGGVLAHLG